MMQWNYQSQVTDVLALGPRTAGRLATVGIRTVQELLAARPHVTTARLRDSSISAEVICQWQREAQLRITMPGLPPLAARLFALAGYGYADRICHVTPTSFLAELEVARQESPQSWLAEISLPSVSEVSEWVGIAREQKKSYAA